MNLLIQLFEKAVIRRAAYWVAPLVIGWASNAWWFQSALQSWGIDPNNMDSVTGGLVLFFGIAVGAIAELVAWYRSRQHKSVKEDLEALMIAARNSRTLQVIISEAEPKLKDAAKSIMDEMARRQAKQAALDAAAAGGPN